jgi:hypothetical protein
MIGLCEASNAVTVTFKEVPAATLPGTLSENCVVCRWPSPPLVLLELPAQAWRSSEPYTKLNVTARLLINRFPCVLGLIGKDEPVPDARC